MDKHSSIDNPDEILKKWKPTKKQPEQDKKFEEIIKAFNKPVVVQETNDQGLTKPVLKQVELSKPSIKVSQEKLLNTHAFPFTLFNVNTGFLVGSRILHLDYFYKYNGTPELEEVKEVATQIQTQIENQLLTLQQDQDLKYSVRSVSQEVEAYKPGRFKVPFQFWFPKSYTTLLSMILKLADLGVFDLIDNFKERSLDETNVRKVIEDWYTSCNFSHEIIEESPWEMDDTLAWASRTLYYKQNKKTFSAKLLVKINLVHLKVESASLNGKQLDLT